MSNYNPYTKRQTMIAPDYEVYRYRSTYMNEVELHHHDFYEIYLLLRGRTRVWGAVLGALIMACAGATVLLNGEPGRVLAPSIVLAMCVLAGLLHDGARTVGSVQEEARP